MNKKVVAAMVVAVVAIFASYNVYTSQKAVVMSDLALSNVEALAYEWDDHSSCRWDTLFDVCLWKADGTYCYCGV